MTTKEDELFLEILDTVNKMDIAGDEKGDVMMEKFAKLYIEMTRSATLKKSKTLDEVVRYVLPEEFL